MANIEKKEVRFHSKASEKYVDVVFHYSGGITYCCSIPITYRRTGTEIEDTALDEYLVKVWRDVNPQNWGDWKAEQTIFWRGKPNAATTKSFFDALSKNFDWCCVSCDLPQNPNWARRVQDLKELGYTLATNTKRHCSNCKSNSTQLILVPLKRGGITGYETWSPELRSKIVSLLEEFDAYEAKIGRKEGLLPDHKFPEIRWDSETRRNTLEHLTDEEIKKDFQLLSNQRNQQKREVCRKCFQTGNRGTIYGIPFFYEGSEIWDSRIPKVGKKAEQGCVGCGWYDINRWRSNLAKKLK
jgi:hypothetical protein